MGKPLHHEAKSWRNPFVFCCQNPMTFTAERCLLIRTGAEIKAGLDNKVRMVQPVTRPPAGPDGSWTSRVLTHRMNRLKIQHTRMTTLFCLFFSRRRSVRKVTPPVWSTLLVLHRPEPTAVASDSDAVGEAGGPRRGRSPSLTPRTGGCRCNWSCRRGGCTGSGRSGRCSSCAAALSRGRKARSRWPAASPGPGR